MNESSLPEGRFSRPRLLKRLREEVFDLLVIGGGATGAGVALDAAARGLRVALVEREDFAAGTSSRSTKLIHGGLRYLERAVRGLDGRHYRLVKESLRERAVLMRLAPHLVRPLAILTPLFRWWQVPYLLSGLKLYDWVAGRAKLGSSRFVTARSALQRLPALRAEGLCGGILYHDGQFDDARMNVSLILTAVEAGAVCANHVAVDALHHEGGAVRGATLEDRLTAERWTIETRAVVNATGPFADEVRQMDRPGAEPLLQVSSGIHLVLDGRWVGAETGMLIPQTEDRRLLFVLPWGRRTLVGTTDEPAEVEAEPAASAQEIDYLLRHLNAHLRDPVGRSDVRAAWAGLRPLVRDPDSGSTARAARSHLIERSATGLITITGGKWTTYRVMAQETVDEAVRTAGLEPRSSCRTDRIPLIGAGRSGPERPPASRPFDPDVEAHLLATYGDRADRVMALAGEGLNRRLAPDHPYLEAEVVHAARAELACTVMDVLARRTRLAFLDHAAARTAVPRVAELMGAELGWDEVRRRRAHETALRQLAGYAPPPGPVGEARGD